MGVIEINGYWLFFRFFPKFFSIVLKLGVIEVNDAPNFVPDRLLNNRF